MYRYISCCRICCCNYYMFIYFSWRISFFELSCSLRSKRFRLVSEQKETVEGDFRFWSREKLNENQTEPPFFARSLTLVPRSLLLNRTETLATQTNFHVAILCTIAKTSKFKTRELKGLWHDSAHVRRFALISSFKVGFRRGNPFPSTQRGRESYYINIEELYGPFWRFWTPYFVFSWKHCREIRGVEEKCTKS